jgi:hypothetical protein
MIKEISRQEAARQAFVMYYYETPSQTQQTTQAITAEPQKQAHQEPRNRETVAVEQVNEHSP